jgi:hypothetical protein
MMGEDGAMTLGREMSRRVVVWWCGRGERERVKEERGERERER